MTIDRINISGENSKCGDKELSTATAASRNIWYNSSIYWSEEACQNRNRDNIGNEDFLPGIKITPDDLPKNRGGTGFETPSAEACQTECAER